MPKSWPSKRKEKKFIIRPCPGPHRLEKSMPLGVLLKDLLNITKLSREIKKILNSGVILVDDRIRKNPRFPIGVMDTISLKNDYYRVIFNKGGKFELLKIKKEEASEKFCKIINKTILKKGKVQINLYDGKNIIVEKDGYKVGDTVVVSNNKIKKHLKFEKGALIYIDGGKHIGEIGKLEEIKKYPGAIEDKILVHVGKNKIETSKEYAFVIENESNARNKD